MRYGKRVAALATITSLVVVACGSDGGSSSDTTAAPEATTGGTTAGTGGAAGESLLNGEIKCEQQYAGKTVSLLSPVRSSENDPNAIQIFTDFWKPFAECTGVKIDFQGTDQFEVQAPVLSRVVARLT